MNETPLTFEVRSPVTGALLATLAQHSAEEVNAAVTRAHEAAGLWAKLGFSKRAEALLHFRRALAAKAAHLAELIHSETGKPKSEAMSEVLIAIQHLSHAATRAEHVLGARSVSPGLLANFKATVRYEPLGVIGVIGPWNYPLFTPMGSIAYALAAGNAVVFKPSELSPLIALELASIAAATLPVPNLLQVVTGLGPTGEALCRSGVSKLAFTGSPRTGRRVMQAAAERLTPVLLELGGKDAMIVLPDADLDKAAEAAVFGSMSNAGQACVSIERCYVHAAVYERFVEKVLAEVQALHLEGEEPQIGPMTLASQTALIQAQLDEAVKGGARILTGGHIEGRYVRPTVLVDVNDDMAVMREETFGPLLPIARVFSAEEAITRANHSKYGLGGSIFGREGVRELAERMRSGMVAINSVMAFSSMSSLPFGGSGESGFGRIHGDEGLREFVRPQSVVEQRFSLPVNPFTMRTPANSFEQLKGMIETLYGGQILDKAQAVLGKLFKR